MKTAIYARKSTDQSGVADDQKSVTRQVEHARSYAAAKGWTMDEASVFVDDGISGAEFANRPGFLRLMNALKPRPPFQVLIMSEESRLGHEAIETAYALKQLVTAGVRVFFYLEDRERTLDSPTDKIMLSLTAFADALEREKARQGTRDAMVRKAHAGYVTGGGCFGYRNVEIVGSDGKRSHVEREIEPTEADIIRQIFRLSAAGYGVRPSPSSSTRRALRRDGRRVGVRSRGRRALFGPFCTGRSIAARSCGRKRRSATNGAGSASRGGLRRIGFDGRPRRSGSSVTTNGTRHTRARPQPGPST